MPATSLHVSLLAVTPDAEALIYAACKQCTSQDDAADVFEKATTHEDCAALGIEYISDEDQDKLIRRVIDSGHTSVVEHVSFSFAISGISRALSHQLVRHRIASYSQQSQRYVDAAGFDYVLPKSIEAAGIGADYIRHMQKTDRLYQRLVEEGVPEEDARFVLPNACETKIVVTMNCRSLLHFFELRCCQRAQWEIRAMATEMLGLCRQALPVVFDAAGARCERLGYCPEDEKFSCGRYPRRDENV